MGTSIVREKRRTQILTGISVAFALTFLGSFISQTVKLARLEGWQSEVEQEIAGLERQKAELEYQIALRDTDEWLGQAAVEAGYLPPNSYAVVVEDEQGQSQVASAAAIAPDLSALVGQPGPAPEAEQGWWSNANWRAWRRLLIGRS